MRVLHINCNYIGTTLHQLMVERLSEIGVQNQVYVPTYSQEIAVIRPNSNVCVSECFKKWDRIAFDYKQKKIFQDIEAKFCISNFNCMHAYTLFTDGNCAMHLSQKYGIPYVVAIRNTDVNVFLKRMVHLRKRGIQIMQNASAIFFLSEAYRRQVFEKYVPKKYYEEFFKKTYVMPNGIDDFWFENKAAEDVLENSKMEGKIRLIYAGRIDKNKNITATQKAMKMLRHKGYEISLTVVGKVDDIREYKRICKDEYTKYIPAQTKENLMGLYREHDVFVMPSFEESFGLVYAEAMSQGLPVLYTRGQGFDQQFPDGVVGYPVNATDVNTIANGLTKILMDYEGIVKRCIDNVIKFQWDAICEKYKEIYTKIVQ